MPLDPQIQLLVDRVNAAAAKAPPIWEQTVDDRREAYRIMSKLAGEGPRLDHVADTTIGGVPVRTYADDGARGTLVFLHGGGHTIGSLDTHDQTCRQLALESAATVVSVDYRLAPEHPFPAGFEDAWTVVRSIAAPDGLVVGGDSAGGNLAASVAIAARDAGLHLAGQLLVYPSVDAADDSPSMTENGVGLVLTLEGILWFRHQHAADPADWRASPILADLSGVAPALVITAEFDPLRDQGRRYVEALAAAGVDVTHTDYAGQPHVFFQLGSFIDAGARAVTEAAAFTRTALDR